MDLNLHYITSSIEGIGGKIKEKPEDFKVEEVPVYSPSGNGTHLFLNITKKEKTTKQVKNQLASLFNLNSREIGTAGLKDKNAVTTQNFSIPLQNLKLEINEIEEKIKNFAEKNNLKVNWFKKHENKLKPGHLLGNNFEITITNLENKNALGNTKKIIKELEKKGLPNYYGKQRFGIKQDNPEKGLQVLKNKIEIKDRWLRKFLLSSFQSYLHNIYLKKRIESGLFKKILKGDIAKKHETGGMFLVENLEQEQKRFENKEISFTCPMFGKKMWEPEFDSKKFEDQILEEQELTEKEINKLGNGSRRKGIILIKNVKVKKVERGLKLNFFLPKGSYATILLREVMKDDIVEN